MKPWLLVMLMALLLPLIACQKKVVLIPEGQMIQKIDDQYYKVSAEWLQERYRFERDLQRKLEKCR